MSDWENNEEIEIFREYLRIPSVHPDIDYVPCIEFLQRKADALGLPLKTYYPGGPTKPVVVITWIGQQPELPGVVLNSHMDVVPAFPESWSHDPFAADMDDEGKIYARGSQDMKCVGTQYLAAIRALKRSSVTLKRTVYIVFVPDEEVGGSLGMGAFVKSDDFKKLNVGFALDEGHAMPDDSFVVNYAERSTWQVHFKISGNTGHGSILLENTVGVKFQYILNKLMEIRQRENERLKNDTTLFFGDVTSINLTRVSGGIQSNVIPEHLTAVFDIRLAITVDHDKFENQLRNWCDEAGGDIEMFFEQKQPKVLPTKIDDSNPYWLAFKKTTDELELNIRTYVLPGGADSRYLRQVDIPALGFSPMNNTPILLHSHDEYLRADTYLRGIEIYEKIIPAISNV